MAQYLMSVWHDDEYDVDFSSENSQRLFAQVGAFNEKLQAAGAWVFANGLMPASSATVLRAKDGQVSVACRERRFDLVRQELLAELRRERIKPPTDGRIERMVRPGLHQAEQDLCARVLGRLRRFVADVGGARDVAGRFAAAAGLGTAGGTARATRAARRAVIVATVRARSGVALVAVVQVERLVERRQDVVR